MPSTRIIAVCFNRTRRLVCRAGVEQRLGDVDINRLGDLGRRISGAAGDEKSVHGGSLLRDFNIMRATVFCDRIARRYEEFWL